MAMRVPRIARSSVSDLVSSWSPCSRIEPLSTCIAPFGSRPITACAVTDLPEPDSPTTQTISSAPTVRLMPCTACVLSPPLMATERFETSRTVLLTSHPLRHFGIERIAQTIAENVDGKDRQGQAHAGIDDVVRIQAEYLPALSHDVAPGRHLRRHADAEERQDGLDENGRGADEGALHDHGRDGVRQHMPPQQFRDRRTERDRGLDIGL